MMSMGLSLRVSQALEIRQNLEAVLSMALMAKQQIKLELKLYLHHEDELTKLYKKALERGKVKLYDKHGMKFEYALVPQKEVPEFLKRDGNWAFSHCLFKAFEALILGTCYAMSRGSWLLFVVEDMYPDAPWEYIQYAAVHERGEQVTLGDHNLASKLEFAIAKKEGRLIEYMDWLEERCPAKFADVFSYQVHLDMPEAKGFQEVLQLSSSSEEATRVREMISAFEWPLRLLQKLNFYKSQSDEIISIAQQALEKARVLASNEALALPILVAKIRHEIGESLTEIKTRDLSRFISFPKMEGLWKELRLVAEHRFLETLTSRKRVMDHAKYATELMEAGVTEGLPKDGVLSPDFREVLQAV